MSECLEKEEKRESEQLQPRESEQYTLYMYSILEN